MPEQSLHSLTVEAHGTRRHVYTASGSGEDGSMRATSIGLDIAVVLAFALAGRASHDEGLSVLGLADTAWPFLLGLVLGWVLVGRSRLALRSLRAGLIIWPVTVAVGMLLRLLTGDGAALSFVLVAAGVLGAAMLGWRAVVTLFGTRSLPAGRHVSSTDSTGGTP